MRRRNATSERPRWMPQGPGRHHGLLVAVGTDPDTYDADHGRAMDMAATGGRARARAEGANLGRYTALGYFPEDWQGVDQKSTRRSARRLRSPTPTPIRVRSSRASPWGTGGGSKWLAKHRLVCPSSAALTRASAAAQIAAGDVVDVVASIMIGWSWCYCSYIE